MPATVCAVMAATVARMAVGGGGGGGKICFLLRNVLRTFASQTDGEVRVAQILKQKFPQAAAIKVVDISGGCGAMYEIHIESEEFKEKRTVQQHQMVNAALSEEIKAMHGLRIFTSVPKRAS